MAATLGFELIHLDEAQCSIDAVTHQSSGFGHRGRSAKVTEGSNRFSLQDLNGKILFSIFVATAAVVSDNAFTEVDVVADNSGPP